MQPTDTEAGLLPALEAAFLCPNACNTLCNESMSYLNWCSRRTRRRGCCRRWQAHRHAETQNTATVHYCKMNHFTLLFDWCSRRTLRRGCCRRWQLRSRAAQHCSRCGWGATCCPAAAALLPRCLPACASWTLAACSARSRACSPRSALRSPGMFFERKHCKTQLWSKAAQPAPSGHRLPVWRGAEPGMRSAARCRCPSFL